jgi:hypothetical protein
MTLLTKLDLSGTPRASVAAALTQRASVAAAL